MTVLLALDTASPRFALAIVKDGQVLASTFHDTPQDHSRAVLAAIESARQSSGVTPNRLVVITGPGSYAGLRVGLATIQGLALGNGLPVTGIGTLPAVAAASGVPKVTAIQAVGRGEFAAQDFDGTAATGNIYLVLPEDLAGVFAGDGAGAIGGIEVGPLDRCIAAARLAADTANSEEPGLDAIYVREPSISRPRASTQTT